MVGWALVPLDRMTISGETKEYASSQDARRHFCPECGTSLFYTNEAMFPGAIDVQIATLDDPDELPPQIHVQVAERIGWVKGMQDLPEFDRYPEGP